MQQVAINGIWIEGRAGRKQRGESQGGEVKQTHSPHLAQDTARVTWIRSQRRRTCDVCHRRAKHDSPVFPVCDCGARRYCGEECQAKDWVAGHAETCASRDLY